VVNQSAASRQKVIRNLAALRPRLSKCSRISTAARPATSSTWKTWPARKSNGCLGREEVYDPFTFTVYIGRQAASIDKLGRTNLFVYDTRGYLTTNFHADGLFTRTKFDAEGRRTNQLDRAGRPTGFGFDALGRMKTMTYPDLSTQSTYFDAAGRVSYTVDARGVTNAFGYDVAGRRIVTTNALFTSVAQTNGFVYDGNGNQRIAFDALGRGTTNLFDNLNRVIQVDLAEGNKRKTVFDVLGRRVAEIDQANVTNRFGYDLPGRLVAVTNAWATPSATWATYKYDQVGNQTNQIDALGRMTRYEQDMDGRRLRRILPGSQAEGFKLDAVGRVLVQTNFINTLIITNQYDSQNRLIGIWQGSTALVSYAYAQSGVRTQMVDSSGTYTWIYDNRDRVRTNITPAGTLYYDYDANGNLTNLTSSTASGVFIAYQYDALNRLTNVVDNRLGLAAKNTRYVFDGVGNLSAIAYPNGATNLWQYDGLNRLTNEVWKTGASALASFAYQLDSTGQRTNLSETVNSSSRTFTWRYDAAQRLTNELILGASPTG